MMVPQRFPFLQLGSTRSDKSGSAAKSRLTGRDGDGGGGGPKPGAQAASIRKRPSGDAKNVFVKDLVFVSQGEDGDGDDGLIVATDGGSMW